MNWKTLISRIKRRANLTDAEIAKKVRTSQQHINRLRIGQTNSPHWELGDRLIGLEKEVRQRPPVKSESK